MDPERTHENEQTSAIGRLLIVGGCVLGLILLTLLSQGWLDRLNNPNRQVKVMTAPGGARQVVLEGNRYGNYVASGRINGREATFLLDTGASDVVVPEAVAAGYGLERGMPMQVRTANGGITVYKTHIESIELGPIRLEDIAAAINPHMTEQDEVLLGMSFLKHLKFQQHDDKLVVHAEN